MAEITVERITYGWRTVIGEITIDAESPHFDRGAIRATLTVRNHTAIYFRDTANLTSAKTRGRILKHLLDKEIALQENVLIALDEACRTSGPTAADASLNTRSDGGVTVRKSSPTTLICKRK
jgi:hypothetical protein